MFASHLRTALRHLRRHTLYVSISVGGLGVGIAGCLFLGLYLRDELSFDRYHEKADRIYRVTLEASRDDESVHWARTPPALAPALSRAFPEVRRAARIVIQDPTTVRVGKARIREDALCYVDAAFFDVFSFTFARGGATDRFAAPGAAVLTRSGADRYVGETDALGHTFTLPGGPNATAVEVVGVVDDMPAASHFHCNAFVSMETLTASAPPSYDFDSLWGLIGVYTYVLLQDEASAARLADRLPAFADRHTPEGGFSFHLQPLARIHLHSHLEGEIEPNGHVTYVFVFGAVALLLLLIACVNVINLTTARATRRAREVGIRKTVGALRGQLIRQFLTESMLFAVLAGLLASGLVRMGLPLFNELSGKAFTLYDVAPLLVATLLGLVPLVGLLAGSYPAFVLSAFRPTAVLKGNRSGPAVGAALRKGLVVLQFTIAVALIASTVVIYNQLRYVQEKPLGFAKEHVLVLPNLRAVEHRDLKTIDRELMRHEGIRGVAAARYAPTRVSPNFNPVLPDGRSEETMVLLHPVDAGYAGVLDLTVVEGRTFSAALASDSSALLINEAAARRFGWADPIGKNVRLPDGDLRRVIGVVRDFHFQSLHAAIEPSVFYLPDTPRAFRALLVRFSPGEADGVLAFLEETWRTFASEEPFDYFFLEESYGALYRAEERIGQMIGVFAGIAIFIACLGLFGLVAFTVERRLKEVGIRKVLGASVTDLVVLLSKDLLRLVALAVAIATPLAYLAMSRWLQGFAYRIDIGLGTFVVAGALAASVALLTVGPQSVRAALVDPSRVLRDE